jgi:hypothetical protein
MTTPDEEIPAAEHKLRQAFEALIKYLDGPESKQRDIELHRRCPLLPVRTDTTDTVFTGTAAN